MRKHFHSLKDQRQLGLFIIAMIFLGVYTIILTLSPAVNNRSWQISFRWEHWIGFTVWLLLVLLISLQVQKQQIECDPYLLPIGMVLAGWGLLTIWRLSPELGMRQTIWLFIALLIVWLGLRFPMFLDLLHRYKYLWLLLGFLLTAFTLVFGKNPIGEGLPHLWLGCCGLYFQPSEPLKLLLIIYLSSYLASFPIKSRNGVKKSAYPEMSSIAQIAPTLIMAGLAILLIIIQGDLGTASIFLYLYAVILYIATGHRWIPLISLIVLVIAGVIGYQYYEVVRLRIDAWWNPWLDPTGGSFQIVQSLMAIANGGLFGRGPGIGNPGLVPVPHSDFIFVAIVEETGLWGGIGLLILFAILAVRGVTIALNAASPFHRFLAAGLTSFLVGQSLLIIAGNIRLFPLTGVTLPFVSYGGSSLLTSFIALLLLITISSNDENQKAVYTDPKPFIQLTTLLLAGISVCAIVIGWWGFIRGPDLLRRTDNPRRALANRIVKRGTIYDRQHRVISHTVGQPGEYERQIIYTPLSSIVGYNSDLYGLSGLEAEMDEYLRGIRGYPALVSFWNQIQYGQPSPGRDIRTSLDLNIQEIADTRLTEYQGALIMVRGDTGEIVAMSSNPNFDANKINENWSSIVSDEGSPLVNRAVQGNYEIGNLDVKLFNMELSEIGIQLTTPTGLPFNLSIEPQEESPKLSPLELIHYAALLTNKGVYKPLIFVTAIDIYQSGWEIFSKVGEDEQLLPKELINEVVNQIRVINSPYWQISETVSDQYNQTYTWYLAGTTPDWIGVPYTLVIVIETDDRRSIEVIGSSILKSAMGY